MILNARSIERRKKEQSAALFIKRTCGVRTAAVFLRNVGWPLDRALRALL